jgi:hypothetical protein
MRRKEAQKKLVVRQQDQSPTNHWIYFTTCRAAGQIGYPKAAIRRAPQASRVASYEDHVMTHNFALERIAGRIFAAFWWVPENGHSSRSAWGR